MEYTVEIIYKYSTSASFQKLIILFLFSLFEKIIICLSRTKNAAAILTVVHEMVTRVYLFTLVYILFAAAVDT